MHSRFQTRALSSFIALSACTMPALASEPITNAPPDQFAWERTAEGVGFAALDGNRFEEAYMAMVRLPAGLVSPAHTKSATMYGVVVSGVLVHTEAGVGKNEETRLPPGSFYKIPADLPHVSKCVSSTDCVTFLYQDGRFDFLPVQP
ncbi:hypothetical protein [Hoeflea prorocentri]|uniref:Cupin n=1 Tax=Hoeflea prorocentri TaxID=1922333 RepID=A0A9X3UI67_9HYPH|nr:hypothetical protein [Hoeflea prorocentri]MCY6381112.1 hypothetical protein [Hoeflea prorocentri]MDA5398912.1 hypothetical protein [Hoeflea prorocentri]